MSPGPLLKDSLKLRLLRWFGRREWIRYGVRFAVLRRFWDPYTPRVQTFELNFFSLQYQGDFECYLDWYVYFFGAYEKEELYLLRDLAQGCSDAVFVDIGANIGQHSLYMAQHCHKVHAFEPYAEVRQRLESGIALNQLANIEIHPVALGAQDEQLDFYAPKGGNTGTGSFLATHEAENNELVGQLQVVNGDAYVESLGLEHIDAVKIDVEGFEKNVLLGLQQTLAKYRPSVLMEFSPSTQESFAGIDEFRSLLPDDYEIATVNPHNKVLGIFSSPSYKLIDFDFDHPGSGLNILLRPRGN